MSENFLEEGSGGRGRGQNPNNEGTFFRLNVPTANMKAYNGDLWVEVFEVANHECRFCLQNLAKLT